MVYTIQGEGTERNGQVKRYAEDKEEVYNR